MGTGEGGGKHDPKKKGGGCFFPVPLPAHPPSATGRKGGALCRKMQNETEPSDGSVCGFYAHTHAPLTPRPVLFPLVPRLLCGVGTTGTARGGPKEKRCHRSHTSHGSSTSLAGRGRAARAHSESDELHPKSSPSLHTTATAWGARASLDGGGGGGPARTPSSSSESAAPSSSEQADPVAPREKGVHAAAAKGDGVAVAATPHSTPPHVTVSRARVPAPGTDRARARQVEGGARDFLHGGGDGGDGGGCCVAVGVEGGGVTDVWTAVASSSAVPQEADVLLCGCGCECWGRVAFGVSFFRAASRQPPTPPVPPPASHNNREPRPRGNAPLHGVRRARGTAQSRRLR